MRSKLIIAVTLITFAILIGCAVKNPVTTPDPITGQPAPAYIPDPRILSLSNTAAGIAAGIAPINPYAGVTDYLVKAVFGVVGILAGYVAQRRNTQAAKDDAAQKQSMLATVIRGVEDTGTAAATVKHAIQTRATAAGVQPQLDSVVQALTS